MKQHILIKILSTTFLVLLFCTNSYAQIEIYGNGGYLISSYIPVNKGDLNIKNNSNFGLGMGFHVKSEIGIEVNWDMRNSSAELLPYDGERTFLTNVKVHHFLGSLVYGPRKGKIRPLGIFSMGVTLFHPTDNNYKDEVLFTIALGLIGKFYLSDRYGIRLQSRLIIPLQFAGGGFMCGTGGCGTYVGSSSRFVEGDFSGGIFIRLGK